MVLVCGGEKGLRMKGKASPIELLKNFVLEANQAEKWISEENWSEMKAYLQKVRLNSFFRSQTVNGGRKVQRVAVQ